MKYKIGDKVRVKSLEWYNNHKNGNIDCSVKAFFESSMSKFSGNILTIKNIHTDEYYEVEENSYYWTDDLFEDLAEEGIYDEEFVNAINTAYNACLDEYNEVPNKIDKVFISDKNYQDKVELCLGDEYEIVVDDGRTFVQKKKPKYPTTYEECCRVLNVWYKEDVAYVAGYKNKLLNNFQKLLICRDAYWKIAGEEMGLDKSWEPDYTNNHQKKWIINFYQNEINFTSGTNVNFVLVFPTAEMRDAFYENFKDLIEKCKEFYERNNV